MTFTFELEEYLDVEKPRYDLLIMGYNGESRSFKGQNILNKNKPKNTLILQFSTLKENHCEGKLISVSNHEIITTTKKILDYIKKICNKDSKIIIDMSSFPTPLIFYFFKNLISTQKIRIFDVLYTEPETYKESSGKYNFSVGTKITESIPNFIGRTKIPGSKLCISLIGFEGRRSFGVMKSMEPKKTIAVNGFPSYSMEFKDTSILHNQRLLKDPSCRNNIVMGAAYDPFQIKKILEKIYTKHNQYNITITPLGTKPMSLGALLFCLNKEDKIRVLFPFPKKYSTSSTSKGWGKTWLYKIQL